MSTAPNGYTCAYLDEPADGRLNLWSARKCIWWFNWFVSS